MERDVRSTRLLSNVGSPIPGSASLHALKCCELRRAAITGFRDAGAITGAQ
jgi:hypothetical protein